jgi:hypothetical protein
LDERRDAQNWEPDEFDTANALASLAVCRSEILNGLKGKPVADTRFDVAIRDGLACLGSTEYALDRLREGSGNDYDMEHVEAIERACDFIGVERLGTRDWYGEFSELLLAHQEPSGAWCDVTGHVQDSGVRRSWAVNATCNALLFLARGTPRVRWTLTAALDDSDINFAVAPTLGDKDFADFLDLVLSRWRRISDAAVKDRLFAKTTAVGPRIVPPLVKRLSSEKDEDRAAAFALLKRATGLDHGYDPAATPETRATAVAAWQAWWTANEKTLHLDAASGRLIP